MQETRRVEAGLGTLGDTDVSDGGWIMWRRHRRGILSAIIARDRFGYLEWNAVLVIEFVSPVSLAQFSPPR